METSAVFTSLEANTNILKQRIAALETIAKLTKKLILDGEGNDPVMLEVNGEQALVIMRIMVENGI